MRMNAEKIKQVLSRYLSGQSSPEERNRVDAWYEQLAFDSERPEGIEKEHLSARMLDRLRKLESHNQKVVRLKAIIRVAAVLLLVSSFAFLFFRKNESASYAHTVIVANRGSHDTTLTLADGSRILLYPGSMISYKEGYAIKHRQLRLMRGRAFFDVAHREDQSFIVRGLRGMEVKVLGTSFDIEQATGSKRFTVRVSTGKVRVSRAQQLLATLVRGQVIKYDCGENKFLSIKEVPTPPVEINFQGISLGYAVQRLSYIYNVKITLSPQVNATLRSTARFNSGQSVKEILDLLCSLHHLKLTESADKSTYHISN